MAEYFTGLHPVMQAFLATLFTWGMTVLGAGVFSMCGVAIGTPSREALCRRALASTKSSPF